MNKMRKAAVSGLAVIAASVTLVGCGEAPEESASGGGGSDFLPCIVSDAGGFDDRSFNQLGFEGLERAAGDLGSEYRDVESNSNQDYAPNVENLVAEGCNVIVGVGFNLAAATVDSANANPDTQYVLIDNDADTDMPPDGERNSGDNLKPLVYNTAEAAFLAGYAAADYSKTGVVGTYGGVPIPTVTIFMDGFLQGVEYHNEQKGGDVRVVGWDGQDGTFTGGFEANQAATNTAAQILDQDADVILPVGGPIYQGALTAIADDGGGQVLIGTDADVFESDPNTQDVILTSIEKGMDVSTYEAVLAAGEGEFDPALYVGNLENEGVSISPFHNFEDQVSETLPGELEEIRGSIIDGSIEVSSYLD